MPAAAGMYYSEQGREKPDQPPVILIHGAGLNHQGWPAEVRHLPGWHVLALDLPGHGQSPGPAVQDIQACTTTLVVFMDVLEIDRAILVGHCLGGAVALSFARSYPDRTAAMTIAGAAGRMHIPARLLENLSLPAGLAAAQAVYMDYAVGPAAPPVCASRIKRLLASTRPGVLKADLLACSQFHLGLARCWFSGPAAILAGTEDPLITQADFRHLSRHILDCRLHAFAGAGHMLPLEQPVQTAAVLSDFLASLN